MIEWLLPNNPHDNAMTMDNSTAPAYKPSPLLTQDFESLEVKLQRRTTKQRVIRTAGMEELLQIPEPDWLIEGILEEGSLSVMYGAPGMGKSFLAMDFALSVLYGRPWAGRGVQQGSVIYVAAEGHQSIAKRLRTWLDYTQLEPNRNFTFALEPIDLAGGPVTLLQFMTEVVGAAQWASVQDGDVEEAPPLKLVVIDTLSRCIVGAEENDASDMSRVVEWLDILRDHSLVGINPAVMVVHHSTKGREYERGSTVLRGAADTMLYVTRDPGGPILKCSKQKNYEAFNPINMKLVPHGEGNVVLVPRAESMYQPAKAEDASEEDKLPVLGDRQLRILRALADSGPEGMDLRTLAKASNTDVPGTHKARTRLSKLGYLDWDRETGISLLTLPGAERLVHEGLLDANMVG